MQEDPSTLKILVPVDGSEQSLRAIRYAANVFPPSRTHIVRFHVQAQLFELFLGPKRLPPLQTPGYGSETLGH